MAQDKYHGKWDRFPFKSFDILKYESVSSIAHHIKALKWFKKQLVIWENQFFFFFFRYQYQYINTTFMSLFWS